MISFLIFCLELFVLYIFSTHIALQTSELFLRLFKNHKASGVLLSILFLPGTFLHEFAHFFMAQMLKVHTTHFTLLPKIGTESIEMGSVGIVKSDPIRRFLIGIAPFLIGTIIILLGVYYFQSQSLQFNSLITFTLIYGLFTISNTMFSSKRDLEGAAQLLAFVLIIIVSLYIVGARLPTTNIDPIINLFEKANQLLIIPLVMDLFVLIMLKIFNSLRIR